MKTQIKLLTKSETTCVYLLSLYGKSKQKSNREEIDLSNHQLAVANVVATISDPILRIREKEHLQVFKSCLRDYVRLNSTVRQDQLLSNLQFATKRYIGRGAFIKLDAIMPMQSAK